VQLVFGEVLCEAGAATSHVYFPIDGFVSLIAQVDAHAGLEVGMVGSEGMVGTQLVLGVPTAPLRALVQGAGAAWRIGAASFKLALVQSPALQRALHSYVYVLLAQTAASAVCLHLHEITPRLARWLLMTQDRAHDERFQVTHEFLALMLGVRRVGVTVAAGDLQRRGLISYHRGHLHVLDRGGLEQASCSCYASDKLLYAQQFGAAA
jgi:CRP-like cAMP-binding protein